MPPQTIPVDPFDCVIFGGTGDLASRKLLPALYHRDRDGQIPPSSRIIAVSRKAMAGDGYRRLVEERVGSHAADPESWARFLALQLLFSFEIGSACFGLVGAPPE